MTITFLVKDIYSEEPYKTTLNTEGWTLLDYEELPEDVEYAEILSVTY